MLRAILGVVAIVGVAGTLLPSTLAERSRLEAEYIGTENGLEFRLDSRSVQLDDNHLVNFTYYSNRNKIEAKTTWCTTNPTPLLALVHNGKPYLAKVEPGAGVSMLNRVCQIVQDNPAASEPN
ncbi:hypothetical protein [Chlorogloeopsis fritschii]|nr:hypothetical protein [Chlorogloeopsis fritschii]